MDATAFIIVGLQYGDEGKGTVVDAFTRKYNSNLTVRFNGGPQAGHNVVDNEGQRHCFSSFGSGTFADARTLLANNVLINPLNIIVEAECLANKIKKNPFLHLYIHEDCRVVTPFHKRVNRILELSREQKHGSCGQGIGEAVEDSLNRPMDVLKAKDLKNKTICFDKLMQTKKILFKKIEHIDNNSPALNEEFKDYNENLDRLLSLYEDFSNEITVLTQPEFQQLLVTSKNPIFEGAQGVLLDEQLGFHPYTTWSRTTPQWARDCLFENIWEGKVKKIGVTRTYMTRHGVGPFVTEDASLFEEDIGNQHNPWQGALRFGWPDLEALKYAMKGCYGLDGLAITHCDRNMGQLIRICTRYWDNETLPSHWSLSNYLPIGLAEQQELTIKLTRSQPVFATEDFKKLQELFESATKTKTILKSFGPKSIDKQWL